MRNKKAKRKEVIIRKEKKENLRNLVLKIKEIVHQIVQVARAALVEVAIKSIQLKEMSKI